MNASSPQTARPAKEPFSWGREIRSWVVLILIVLGIHSFVAKPFYIPSESMMATLLVGDRLIVSKFPYGFSYLSPSLPVLPKMNGRLFGSMPERGDIIVLKSPSDGADWIKRVIALPGDVVEMRNGELWLNGQPLPRQRVADTAVPITPNTGCPLSRMVATDDRGRPVCNYATWRETLPGDRSYDTLDIAPTELDNFPASRVPEGTLFLMGDNRDNSKDSRVPAELGGLGFVPYENIVGRAEFTTFSLDGTQSWNPLSWPGALRGDRAFISLRK